MNVKKGTFNAPASTGNQASPSIGFAPKAVILWATKQTATGYQAGACLSIGLCVSSSQRKMATAAMDDNVATSNTGKKVADLAISIVDGTPTVQAEADFVSMDADTFTLNWTTASPTYLIHYIALGGSDITNAFVGSSTPAAATGNAAVTGVGFQPDCVIMVDTTVSSALPAASVNASIGIGAFVSTSQRGSAAVRSQDAVNPVGSGQWATALACSMPNTTTEGANNDADFVAFGSDGFTLNWIDRVSASHIFYLCLKGGSYWVGQDTQKTSTGTKSKTGIGFKPAGLLAFGGNAVANSTFDFTQSRMSIGGTDGSAQGCVWISDTDNISPSDANTSSVTTQFYRHATNPSTTDAEATISSLDSDGYTLNWGTADATAREFTVLALGPFVGGGGGGPPKGSLAMMGVGT